MKERLQKTIRKIKRAVLRDEPGYYDMFLNPGERFFGRMYLEQIKKTFAHHGMSAPLKILDAGCQTGRLSIPLALAGHQVTGVDTSGLALSKAQRHAKEAGTKLQWIRADLGQWLPKIKEASFDAVVCAEVLYLRQNYRELLSGLIRCLRPNGICFISHRPAIYYLSEALQHKDMESVRRLLSENEGQVLGSYYNWQDRHGLEQLYQSLGVQVLEIPPMGLLSWLSVKPEEFSPQDQEWLMRAEQIAQKEAPGVGRYLLVCGRKL